MRAHLLDDLEAERRATAVPEPPHVVTGDAEVDPKSPHATSFVCGRRLSLGRGRCEEAKMAVRHDIEKDKCPLCGPNAKKCVTCGYVVMPLVKGVKP
jgi:hypothetical protein